jgi:hypothetical protein
MPGFSLLPTADDLNAWAETVASESELARLIQKLILHTASPTGFRVPVDKATNTPGWDGVVEVAAGSLGVPAGRSFWEWGAGPVPDKAQRDYTKRTNATDEVLRLESTFVFVTPRHWKNRDEWLAEKRKEAKWAAVDVHDASFLDAWMEKAIVVRLWLAEILHKPVLDEARTLEASWNDWTDSYYRYRGTGRLAIAGREPQAEQVRSWVETASGYHSIGCPSTEEGIAFVAAAMLASEAHERAVQQAIVVRGPRAWDDLATVEQQPMVLIPNFVRPDVGKALARGHVVIEPVLPGRPGHVDLSLSRGIDAELSGALQQMGLDFATAEAAVHASAGRSSALRRRVSSAPRPPEWARHEDVRFLAPAFFAARWDQDLEGDRAALEALAGMAYGELQAALLRLSQLDEAPVSLLGSIWSADGLLDAWAQAVGFVTNDGWKSFIEVAIEVLGARDPAFDLPSDERWLANVKGKTARHSDYIRRGISESVAMIGSQSEFAGLPQGRSGADVAAVIVSRLLAAANTDHTGELWASLEVALPWLAEAAPTAFLDGVSRGLEGGAPVLERLFAEERSIISARTHLPGLLWALERLAWSPDYLSEVTVILARLASLDPGLKSGNRPANTLMEIFLPWHPQTSAEPDARLAAIDAARTINAALMWPSLVKLLPTRHGIAMPTARPVWRAWAPPTDAPVTRGAYSTMVAEILRRLLADAGADLGHWADLVDAYDDLPEDLGDRILEGLAALDPSELSPLELRGLSDRIQQMVANHRAYATAEWAMPESRVIKLEAVAEGLTPADPVLEHRWLFEWHPATSRVSGADYRNYETALARQRDEALRIVFNSKGWPGIEELVTTVENAYTVGIAAGGLDDTLVENGALNWGEIEDEAHLQALQGYLFARHRKSGWEWVEKQVRDHRAAWGDAGTGAALLAVDNQAAGWRLAEELGPDVERAYWARFRGFPSGADQWVAAKKLLAHARPFAAVQLIGTRRAVKDDVFDADTAYLVLDAAANATEPPAPAEAMGIDYDIGQILIGLDEAKFDERKLADLEWVFLRVLERDPDGLQHLHRRIAREPSFFVELVKVLYRPDQGSPAQERDPDPELARYAEHVWTLLDSWKGPIPGLRLDGEVDEAALREWITTARALLAEAHRLGTGDQQIGRALWYSPGGEDGLHPHEAVRRLIEQAASGDIDTGFHIEAYNSRGATFRGTGGDQERSIAADYSARAAAFTASYPRTARIFRELAESYETQGRSWDVRALREDG